jgi:hypothetical protein
MDALISIAAVVLPVCAIVLAVLILVRLGETASHAQAMQARFAAFQSAAAMLGITAASTSFKSEIKRLAAHPAMTATGPMSQSSASSGSPAQSPHPAETFLAALQRCKGAGLRLQDQVRAWANEIDSMLQKRSRRMPEIFRENSADILKAVIQVADNQVDVKQQNVVLQNALNEMVALAGLELIAPNAGARRDDLLHKPFQAVHEPGRQRGTIASVAIRGLMRPSGAVILKAHVNLFS